MKKTVKETPKVKARIVGKGTSVSRKATAPKSSVTAKRYYFGKLKKISLDNLEVFGTISSSISEKEINSLELSA